MVRNSSQSLRSTQLQETTMHALHLPVLLLALIASQVAAQTTRTEPSSSFPATSTEVSYPFAPPPSLGNISLVGSKGNLTDLRQCKNIWQILGSYEYQLEETALGDPDIAGVGVSFFGRKGR